jgi:hypothetical protein
MTVSLLAVLGSCGFSFSQRPSEVTVAVRVLDYKSGHPARGRKVAISTVLVPENNRDWVIAKTKKGGVALFTIREPLPIILWIDPEAGSSANFSCTRADAELDLHGVRNEVHFSGVLHPATFQVLQRGIVGTFTNNPLCQPHTPLIPPQRPGVIVIFTRHLSPWLEFRRLWEY